MAEPPLDPITITAQQAMAIAISAQYRTYIMDSGYRLGALTEETNPNRKHGIGPTFFGIPVEVVVKDKPMAKTIDQHEGKKYLRRIVSAQDNQVVALVDVYAVLTAFGVTCPARAHAIKKLLCCGNRDKGSEMADLLGVEAAVARAIELQAERDREAKDKTP